MENPSENHEEERISPTAPAWRRATELARENPLAALGLAALGGFVIGGGARTRVGGAALLLVARMAFREAITGSVAQVLRAQDGTRNGRD